MDSLDPGVSLLSEDSNVGLGRPIPTETEFERLLEDSVEMETQHLAPSSPELATGATAQVVRHCFRSPVGVLPDASSTSRTVLQGSGKVQAQDSWAMVGLSGRLEDLCRDLRRSVEHEFGLSERQLQAQHQAELEAQRLRHETLSHQQQVKIENLEMEVKTLSKKLETKQKQVKDALALTGHVRQNMLARLAFDSGFRMWQARAAESKHNQLQDVLAKKLHDVHMSANFLSAWRQISQTSSREKLLAHERASAGAVRAKLFEQMETERNQLVAQVEDLNKQLGEEAKQRAVLQDNLKRVFMRGVCALNFEAMSLLNDPQGGTATMNAAALAGATEVLAAQTEPPGPPVLPEQQEKAQTEPVAVAALPAEGADSMDDTMQPQVSPTPLPFVSYTGPAARTTGSRGALPKSQRWLASASPARIEKPLAAR